jgi:hypothetical protein
MRLVPWHLAPEEKWHSTMEGRLVPFPIEPPEAQGEREKLEPSVVRLLCVEREDSRRWIAALKRKKSKASAEMKLMEARFKRCEEAIQYLSGEPLVPGTKEHFRLSELLTSLASGNCEGAPYVRWLQQHSTYWRGWQCADWTHGNGMLHTANSMQILASSLNDAIQRHRVGLGGDFIYLTRCAVHEGNGWLTEGCQWVQIPVSEYHGLRGI